MPQKSNASFGKILGKVARTALSGVAVYVVVSVLSGKTGQKRLRQDFAIVSVSLAADQDSLSMSVWPLRACDILEVHALLRSINR